MTPFRLPILRVTLTLLATIIIALLLTFALGTRLHNAGQLAYTSARDGDQDIYLLDIGRGMTFNLTHTATNEWQVVWSPDGTQISFVSDRSGNDDIYTLTVACPGIFAGCAGQTGRITTNPANDVDPVWSPDGEHIAFTSDRFGYTEIFVAALQGGVPVRLTNNDALDANPAWSPDGQQIVFSSNRDDQTNVDLYSMDTDGGNAHRILERPGNEFSTAWSPDGRDLVFGTFFGGANRQLALLDLETHQTTLLLDDVGNDDTPAFSPDGQLLAFMSYIQSGDSEIYVTHLDCTGTRADCAQRLTFSRYMDTYPQWRPG